MKPELHIIKIGGNVIDNETLLDNFLSDFSRIDGNKILIHGGGKIATELSKKLGITPQMVNGRRITDAETLKVVSMVYAGLINKSIVAKLQSKKCNAIGLCGADGNILPADKRPVGEIDYGFVGDINEDSLNSEMLGKLLSDGLTPVIAPITHDGKGQLLNTNADTIASALAIALLAKFSVNLIYCFEKKGVLMNAEDEDSFIENINSESYYHLKSSGIISDGMIPKMDNAFIALKKGVLNVWIGHAKHLKEIINEEKNAGSRLSI